MRKNIAIIGSGFFGSLCAIILSKKYNIDLFEKNGDILSGASKANQLRFHLGYHYPRSNKTVNEIRENYKDFINFFGNKIFGETKNYYGISKKDSKTNFISYLKFLKKNKLYYKRVKSVGFNEDNLGGQIISKEKNLNYFKAKNIILKKLNKRNINIFLKTEFKKKNLKNYKKIIIACYDQNNKILKNLGCSNIKKYKYELVEKIIIQLPKKYMNKSYMVIDGSFVCLDPYVGTKFHLLSNVKHSKLEIKEGINPNFKSLKKNYLNQGIINSKNSKFKHFINDSVKFLPFLRESKYIGSFFVTRAINKNKEKTDERLNEITFHGEKIISIFSGKWNTCIGVAKEIEKLIKNG